jgi:hypothetical protein
MDKYLGLGSVFQCMKHIGRLDHTRVQHNEFRMSTNASSSECHHKNGGSRSTPAGHINLCCQFKTLTGPCSDLL